MSAINPEGDRYASRDPAYDRGIIERIMTIADPAERLAALDREIEACRETDGWPSSLLLEAKARLLGTTTELPQPGPQI